MKRSLKSILSLAFVLVLLMGLAMPSHAAGQQTVAAIQITEQGLGSTINFKDASGKVSSRAVGQKESTTFSAVFTEPGTYAYCDATFYTWSLPTHCFRRLQASPRAHGDVFLFPKHLTAR